MKEEMNQKSQDLEQKINKTVDGIKDLKRKCIRNPQDMKDYKGYSEENTNGKLQEK